MKLAQTIFLLIILNLLMSSMAFVLKNDDISDFIDSTDSLFDSSILSIGTFTENSQSNDKWSASFFEDVAAAFQNSINTVIIIFLVIGLVLTGLISLPNTVFTENSLPILRYVGGIGWLFLMWVNVKSVISLISYIKGSST